MNTEHVCILPPMADLRRLFDLDEAEAKERLTAACLQHPVLCPRCFSRETLVRKSGRCGCAQCGCGFDILDGRWFSSPSIPARSWIILIKCFELGLNVRESGRMAGVPRSTAYRAFRNLRLGLACRDPLWSADPLAALEALLARAGNGFAAYLRNWTARYRGMSPEEYPYYVNECHARFSSQGRPLFDRLLACAAAPKPIKVAS